MTKTDRWLFTLFVVIGCGMGALGGILGPSGDWLLPWMVVWLAVGGGGLLLKIVWTLR